MISTLSAAERYYGYRRVKGVHMDVLSVPRVGCPSRFNHRSSKTNAHAFELLLFTVDPHFVQRAVAAGVDGIIVDCEHIGKVNRQAGADTEINYHTIADLRQVRACTNARVICRINRYGPTTGEEVEQVIAAGADEILLPMVQTLADVEQVLDQVRGRCDVGILVETIPALAIVAELARLPLSRVYLGLNDLGIARKTPNIFTAVADGTLEYVRQHFRVPFGFGGVTLPDRGFPIPCRLLMGELARLNCDFSFLRRSFWADTRGRDLRVEIPLMRSALTAAFHRPASQVARERAALYAAIADWNPMTKHAGASGSLERAVGAS